MGSRGIKLWSLFLFVFENICNIFSVKSPTYKGTSEKWTELLWDEKKWEERGKWGQGRSASCGISLLKEKRRKRSCCRNMKMLLERRRKPVRAYAEAAGGAAGRQGLPAVSIVQTWSRKVWTGLVGCRIQKVLRHFSVSPAQRWPNPGFWGAKEWTQCEDLGNRV